MKIYFYAIQYSEGKMEVEGKRKRTIRTGVEEDGKGNKWKQEMDRIREKGPNAIL